MVKLKTGRLPFLTARSKPWLKWLLPAFLLPILIFSWLGLFPAALVERWYAHAIFPKLSYLAGRGADAVGFSWLDIGIAAAAIFLVQVVRKRQWLLLLNVAAAAYLIFFWTWGLNYHRMPLASKLMTDSARGEPDAMTAFARRAASELNRLYAEKQSRPYDEAMTQAEAARRVRRVVAIIDGVDWRSAERAKISWFATPWFRAAGIDGVFNPLFQEPVINRTVLDIDRPFVLAHELAHVRGYPDEGDANVIATFATLMSDDPAFQYSGWLNLWLYLRTRELDKLLDAGPQSDLRRIFERARTEQIRWISGFQQALLDVFLKANSVHEGVRSYSRVVLTAAETEPYWKTFR